MIMSRVIVLFAFVCLFLSGTLGVRAASCEDVIARHMVGEALLTANLVSAAEKAGTPARTINVLPAMPT